MKRLIRYLSKAFRELPHKRKLLLLFIALPYFGLTQNLIPNPSFETGDCPETHNHGNKPITINHWISPDTGTPDYFHLCSSGDAGVPRNWAGYSEPSHGKAYAGIYLRKGSSYREHLQVEFTEPLQKDSMYHLQFFVKGAASGEYMPENISIAISKTQVFLDMTKKYDQRMHSFSIPQESLLREWYEVNYTYLAAGGEKFLVVGALCSCTRLHRPNRERLAGGNALNNATYVYLDNFYLGLLTPDAYLQVSDQLEEHIVLADFLFEFNSSELKSEAHVLLDSIAQYMLEKELHAFLIGKTDSVGTDAFNYQLGMDRANSVASYLISRKIFLTDLSVVSEGEAFPRVSNESEKGRAENRSVIIQLMKK